MATLNVKNFPDALHRKLQARAKLHRRSLAQEVTQILSDAVNAASARSRPNGPARTQAAKPALPESGGYHGRDSGWD